jgi:hypothetical protein
VEIDEVESELVDFLTDVKVRVRHVVTKERGDVGFGVPSAEDCTWGTQ